MLTCTRRWQASKLLSFRRSSALFCPIILDMVTVQDAYHAGFSSAFGRFKLASMKDMLQAAQMKGVAKTHPALRNPATFDAGRETVQKHLSSSAESPLAGALRGGVTGATAQAAGKQAALHKFSSGLAHGGPYQFSHRSALPMAAIGAAGGAIRHALSDDPESSLAGNMLGGAAIGGGLGVGATAGTNAVLRANPHTADMIRGAVQKASIRPGFTGAYNRFMHPNAF